VRCNIVNCATTHSRDRYDTARKLKEKQDAYCAAAERGLWDGLGQFPEELQWEALVDVLRGRVKVGPDSVRPQKIALILERSMCTAMSRWI
jgi:hypothetical protein